MLNKLAANFNILFHLLGRRIHKQSLSLSYQQAGCFRQ